MKTPVHFKLSQVAGSRFFTFCAGVILLGIVGWLDWVTGPNMDFSLFYLIPVGIVAWYGGQNHGLMASVASAAVWLCVDRLTGAKTGDSFLIFWNLILRLAFFSGAVLLMEAWKDVGVRLSSTVEQRTAALRRLARQLSAAEDAERRKLAYDLHDALSQSLSLIKMNVDAAQLESADGGSVQRRLADCGTLVDGMIKQTRTLMFDLYPSMLDDLGLVPTLQWYAREFEQRVGTQINISEQGVRIPLPATLTNYLFRSVKELFSNAVRHGHAKEVFLSLHWDAGSVRVVVDDDGTGFDVQAVRAPDQGRGLGLAGIRERLNSMGGRMEVESRPGQGSRVILEVPLPVEGPQESDDALAHSAG